MSKRTTKKSRDKIIKKLKKQIDRNEISLNEARRIINDLYANQAISIIDVRLIDGILMRKDLRDAVT